MLKRLKKNEIAVKTVAINLIFFLLYFLMFEIQFEQDDGSMALIAYSGDEHLVFINIVIGFLIKFLLACFPSIAWYFVLEIVCVFVSFVIITHCINQINRKYGFCFSVLLLLTFGYNAYVYPQFTKTAVLLTLAGLCILFCELSEEKINCLKIISSFICLFLGICYRRKAFFMTCACLSFFIIYTLAKKIPQKSKKFVCKFIFVNVLIFVVCLSSKYIDNYFYQGEEWTYYRIYSSYRSTLLDYDFPSIEENQKLYNELGLTENDIKVFKSWNIADTEVFDIETLKVLAEAQKKENDTINLKYIITFIREMIAGLMKYHWIIAFLITFMCLLIFVKCPKWYLLGASLVLFVLELYLYHSGRVLLNRIQYGIFLSFSVENIIYVLEYGQSQNKKNIKVMVVGSLLVLLTFAPEPPHYNYKSDYEIYSLQDEDIYHVYFDTSTSKALGVKSELWQSPNVQRDRNYMQFGSWTTYIPMEWELYQRYNITNMYRDMVNNSRVYLNDSVSNELIISHIKCHYDQNAELCEVKNIGGIPVYRVISSVEEMLPKDNEIVCSSELKHSFEIKNEENNVIVDGYAYFEAKSSYQGNGYVIFKDEENSKAFCMTLRENLSLKSNGDLEGAYSCFYNAYSLENIGFIPKSAEIIYEYNGEYFQVGKYLLD